MRSLIAIFIACALVSTPVPSNAAGRLPPGPRTVQLPPLLQKPGRMLQKPGRVLQRLGRALQ